MFKFNQGDETKDTITGFSGIIVARTDFYNGCIRYGIQSKKLNKDGSTLEIEYFDEEQLEIIKSKKIIKKEKRTGGPKPATPKYRD